MNKCSCQSCTSSDVPYEVGSGSPAQAPSLRSQEVEVPKIDWSGVSARLGPSSRPLIDAKAKETRDAMAQKMIDAWPAPDLINHPPHYASTAVEVIDAIEAWFADAAPLSAIRRAHVVRYVSRAHKKGNALSDLKKAKWYLDREIAALEEVNTKDGKQA